MKRLFILIFLFFVSVSYSQFIKGYGLKIGATNSHQSWGYTAISPVRGFDPDNKIGFNIGLFAEHFNYSNFQLITELNYVQKGIQKEIARTESESPEILGKVLWKLMIDYVNISILAKPKFALEKVTPYLLFGPRIDFEIAKSLAFDEARGYDNFKKSRTGVKMGLGSEINLFNMRFLTELVYDLDLLELYENENVKVTSYSFDFRIGVYL
ncbi:MAG: hypothetical protein FD143_1093 [Ignavibacteria bacterium]|nr:MAG: hypothetical protein FD143_1093 [Ignavibacteria bacterium]KAF0161024.1 MAG: hypothetical protein FD188_1245 [Ignavibacteria bacterium]